MSVQVSGSSPSDETDTGKTCINFDELWAGYDIISQGLNYNQVRFEATGDHARIGDSYYNSAPFSMEVFYDTTVTAHFKTPVSWLSLWAISWSDAGPVTIYLYASDGELLGEAVPPLTPPPPWGDPSYYEFSYAKKISKVVIISYWGQAAFDDFCFEVEQEPPTPGKCGEILKFTINDGTYPPGQIVRATMLYKSLMSTRQL